MPARGCDTVPVVVVPSPQLMGAVKSLATLLMLVSVKARHRHVVESNVGLRGDRRAVRREAIAFGNGDRSGWRDLVPSLMRVMVTSAWSLPSSA